MRNKAACICRHCEEEFYSNSGRTGWCPKAECQEAKSIHKKLQQRENYEKWYKAHRPDIVGNRTYKHICEHCGETYTDCASISSYCTKPECQEAKKLNWRENFSLFKLKKRKKKNLNAHSDSNWTFHRVGNCENCKQLGKLNRFKICSVCYLSINDSYGPLAYGSGNLA